MSMELTKRLWEQPTDKGVLAYHIIQSFSPGEATPDQVHEIGCEFARRFLADRFECTVSTHLDKGHLHNHIVVNSVSYADGKMFRNNFDTYYHGIRQVSDELCRENRLSVIETDGKGRSYDEWLSGQAGKPTIRGMTISEYPQQLDDKFISALLQQVPYIVLSIDIEPVETEDAFKEIDNAQMKTDAEKVRFNKKSVENLDFTSSVPQRTQEQDRIIANIRKEMTENDQQMFLSLLTVTYFADTLEDLALETDALKTTAANYNCRFTELYFQQERAFNTAMPYGLRRIESVRTMLTKSLTALVPFNTQEILTPGGICYGRNAVTGNLIIGLRTTLVNGNAMVVATSGGGKSMFVKLEILMLYLRFTKARFYIVDPENEYAPLVQELGGEVVNISVDSSTYFNPLDFKPDKSTDIPPYVAKAEFVLSLCEQIMKKENVLPGDRSLIDRALNPS